MASTIKLKTSTSSGNVPASLSQGEVAINVADGVWYYGGASAVQQNFKFGSVTVTGNTSLDGKLVVTGNTVMNGTLSATTSLNVGNGNGTISAATVTGTILKGILGSDAAPVTAYINNGEIDGATLGGESAVTIAGANYIDITNSAADNVALSVLGADGQSVNFFDVSNSEGEVLFSIASNGRAVTNAVDIGGGAIDGTPIGTSSRSSGKFTTMDVNSTLVVTGNTVLNGTLSASSVNVGNGAGSVSAATITSSGDMTAGGDVYTDVLRRQSDSSTTTKIKLDDETVKTFGGSSSVWTTKVESQKLLVGQSGAGVISASTIHAKHTLSAGTDLHVDGALVVTGNTVMNGTLSASSINVGNGAGSISANTITAAGTMEADLYTIQGVNAIDYVTNTHLFGSTSKATKLRSQQGIEASSFINITAAGTALIVTGNTVLNGTLSATTSCKVGNGDGLISGATITAGETISLADGKSIEFGNKSGGDGKIKHSGSNLQIQETTGNIQITNYTNDGDITLSTDDGTGSETTYITLDGGLVNTRIHTPLVVTGNTVLNGTLSATTSAKIGNGDGLVSAATVTAAGSVTLPDDGKLKLGNAGDLEIYHDSNNSYIDDTGTGTIFYRSGTQTFQNAAGSKTMATFNAASTVDLAFNNNVKLSTNNSGVHIDGTVSANTAVYAGTGVDDGVISANTVNGSYQFITFVGNSGALDSDNWQYPGTNGISNHTWGYEADGSGTSTGSSTISISRTKQMSGIVLPAGTRVVGIVGTLRSSTDDTAYAGLFTYQPDYGGPDTVDATLRLVAQSVDDSGGASVLNDPQFFKADAAFASQYVVQEGDQLLPAFRRTSTSNQTVVGTFTIIVKY